MYDGYENRQSLHVETQRATHILLDQWRLDEYERLYQTLQTQYQLEPNIHDHIRYLAMKGEVTQALTFLHEREHSLDAYGLTRAYTLLGETTGDLSFIETAKSHDTGYAGGYNSDQTVLIACLLHDEVKLDECQEATKTVQEGGYRVNTIEALATFGELERARDIFNSLESPVNKRKAVGPLVKAYFRQQDSQTALDLLQSTPVMPDQLDEVILSAIDSAIDAVQYRVARDITFLHPSAVLRQEVFVRMALRLQQKIATTERKHHYQEHMQP